MVNIKIIIGLLLVILPIYPYATLREAGTLSTVILSDFGVDQGWGANHLKLVADFNNDGLEDIIGFFDNDVYISYCNKL